MRTYLIASQTTFSCCGPGYSIPTFEFKAGYSLLMALLSLAEPVWIYLNFDRPSHLTAAWASPLIEEKVLQ